jgi:hypothetical protein
MPEHEEWRKLIEPAGPIIPVMEVDQQGVPPLAPENIESLFTPAIPPTGVATKRVSPGLEGLIELNEWTPSEVFTRTTQDILE